MDCWPMNKSELERAKRAQDKAWATLAYSLIGALAAVAVVA